MNSFIIENWNKTVCKNDRVFHLGDFGFGTIEELQKLVDSLNGDIILIKGNHDILSVKAYYETGFKLVYNHSIFIGDNIIMSHKPIGKTTQNYIYYHGHTHSETFRSGNQFNVCCEALNYKPIELLF